MAPGKQITVEYKFRPTTLWKIEGDGELREVYDSMIIKQLKAMVAGEVRQMTGLVTVWFENKQVTNLNSTIEYVFRKSSTGKPGPLEFRYDPSVSVANGGYAMGAVAVAKKGGQAKAGGGRGDGGVVDKDGNLFGGEANGGDALDCVDGVGGRVWGGKANIGKATRDGQYAQGGDGFAGEVVRAR
ncbi:hypothetical protein MFIFM68171_08538 [Madurella fahalii]|uniref:Uncharacterized protein n=1 Tax=Madurella fahalii TaxID=1157608 RepID=A0ABQ0GKP6_9PEZI